MSETKELFCLNVLNELLKNNFSINEYSLNGPKECAVCLERKGDLWEVYEKERNSYNDKVVFGNVVEACIEMIERMFLSKSDKAKKDFFESIIISDIA